MDDDNSILGIRHSNGFMKFFNLIKHTLIRLFNYSTMFIGLSHTLNTATRQMMLCRFFDKKQRQAIHDKHIYLKGFFRTILLSLALAYMTFSMIMVIIQSITYSKFNTSEEDSFVLFIRSAKMPLIACLFMFTIPFTRASLVRLMT